MHLARKQWVVEQQFDTVESITVIQVNWFFCRMSGRDDSVGPM